MNSLDGFARVTADAIIFWERSFCKFYEFCGENDRCGFYRLINNKVNNINIAIYYYYLSLLSLPRFIL